MEIKEVVYCTFHRGVSCLDLAAFVKEQLLPVLGGHFVNEIQWNFRCLMYSICWLDFSNEESWMISIDVYMSGERNWLAKERKFHSEHH